MTDDTRKSHVELDRERAARMAEEAAAKDVAAAHYALRSALAHMRTRHARLVVKVLEAEQPLPPPGLNEVIGAIGGCQSPTERRRQLLAELRVKRDVAAESIRYLEGRLGTVILNDG